jgi:hypothetical protein
MAADESVLTTRWFANLSADLEADPDGDGFASLDE